MKEKRVFTEKTINNYLTENGELINTDTDIKHTKIIVQDKEEFASIYASVIGIMSKLQGRDIKVLTYCALHSEVSTNRISFTKVIVDEMAEQLNTTYNGVHNSIGVLAKNQILISLGKGTYRINPKYYWRGNSVDRVKTMKYILEIECVECL